MKSSTYDKAVKRHDNTVKKYKKAQADLALSQQKLEHAKACEAIRKDK